MDQSYFAGSSFCDQRQVVSNIERCRLSGPRKEFKTDRGRLTFTGKMARRVCLIDCGWGGVGSFNVVVERKVNRIWADGDDIVVFSKLGNDIPPRATTTNALTEVAEEDSIVDALKIGMTIADIGVLQADVTSVRAADKNAGAIDGNPLQECPL